MSKKKQKQLENMKFKDKWNLDYDKAEMKHIAIGGAIAAVAAGVAGAFLDLLLWKAESNFFIGLFLVCLITSAVINIIREEYHVKYSALAVGYSAIGILILHGLRYFLIFNPSVAGFFEYLFLYPFYRLYQGIANGQAIGILYGCLTIIAYFASFALAYFFVKIKSSDETKKK